MDAFLQVSEIIDWTTPAVLTHAQKLAQGCSSDTAIARRCFEWVRDSIKHSSDFQMNPLTCKASEVLQHRTGYCYAKSHLLAALLRANRIPAGLCYQRLSVNDPGPPYCLHGFNAVHLLDFGWYRMDARGNKACINAQFTPPQENLAFTIQFPEEETTFEGILAEPLPQVVRVLQGHKTWDEALQNLPDMTWAEAEVQGLIRT